MGPSSPIDPRERSCPSYSINVRGESRRRARSGRAICDPRRTEAGRRAFPWKGGRAPRARQMQCPSRRNSLLAGKIRETAFVSSQFCLALPRVTHRIPVPLAGNFLSPRREFFAASRELAGNSHLMSAPTCFWFVSSRRWLPHHPDATGHLRPGRDTAPGRAGCKFRLRPKPVI